MMRWKVLSVDNPFVKKPVERPFRAQLIHHIPTDAILLQVSEKDAYVIGMHPTFQRRASGASDVIAVGKHFTIQEPRNYVKFDHAVILSNDDVALPTWLLTHGGPYGMS